MASKLVLMIVLIVISLSCIANSHRVDMEKGKPYFEKKLWPRFPRYGGRLGGGVGFSGGIGQRSGGALGGNDGFGHDSGSGSTFGDGVRGGELGNGNANEGKFEGGDVKSSVGVGVGGKD